MTRDECAVPIAVNTLPAHAAKMTQVELRRAARHLMKWAAILRDGYRCDDGTWGEDELAHAEHDEIVELALKLRRLGAFVKANSAP